MNPHSPFHPQAVGRRLAALRVYKEMIPAHFADSVDIDRTSYGRIEKGEKPLKADMAFRIAERYGVTMDYLYRGRLTELPPKLADSLMHNLTKSER
ncbi:helix-turn-helix transcriptional regulator [Roseovarius aestuarii]|nr:helix-turn-helix transcriptional regulator [Roseovarius aestuarii]